MKKIFSGKIRNGKFGTLTDMSFDIVLDPIYGYARLSKFPKIDYETSSYRELVNNSGEANEYFKIHDSEQAGYFNFISEYLSRSSTVVDCGCGGGSLLDLVGGLVKKTIAIEPYLGYHNSLMDRGHQVFPSLDKANLSDVKASLALSMQVIEHTENPLEYLKGIFDVLEFGGKLILFTPNLNDIMLKLNFEAYAPFFFRTVHNYYFTAESLKKLGKEVGFKVDKILYYQDFGLDNAIYWLRDKKPCRNQTIDGIDNSANSNWKNYLEATGQSYNVGIVLSK